MRQNLNKLSTMDTLSRLVMAVVLLAALQGMAVDVTCMLLWHTSPLELAEGELEDTHDHHPNSPDSHQGLADVVSLFGELGTLLLDYTDVPVLAKLLPTPQDGRHLVTENLIYQPEPPPFDKGDPPKQMAVS